MFLNKIRDNLKEALKNPYFGFIDYNTNFFLKKNYSKLNELIYQEDDSTIKNFENEFSNLIGKGSSISFASARMGFYAILKSLKIGLNDEIIIQGYTCSVMINAIFRAGAKPIFSDIDRRTFGSSAKEIERKISKKTKLIVAQHSFGIPCDIEEISNLAKNKNLYLVEDCALTLSSKISSKTCGTFGDAAIFSTDRSKPLNLFLGGLVYTEKDNLKKKIYKIRNESQHLSLKKKISILKQIKFEIKNSFPEKYGLGLYKNSIRLKILKNYKPYLDKDNSSSINNCYPYPAKFPSFLALLGINQIKNWKNEIAQRKKFLDHFLNIIPFDKKENFAIYYDKNRDIVPLRVAWAPKNGRNIRVELSKFLDIRWTWFLNPIVDTSEPIQNFMYVKNSCPISEEICEKIVNIPCNLRPEWSKILLECIKNSIF